uniref:Uncharacterized protein n=1 Tax=Eikenella corrodens TaxID=539 RepID=A0A1A9RKU9_EIKCO|nr:hypothetical protein A7P90_05660 [Eikenella corrodens]
MLIIRPVAFLYGFEIFFRNQRLVGLPNNPLFRRVGFVAAAFVIHGLPDVDTVFQHMRQTGSLPFSPAPGIAAPSKAAGDGNGTLPRRKTAEGFLHQCFFSIVRHQFTAFSLAGYLIAERCASAVKPAFFRIFQHGAAGVATDLARYLLIHNLHNRIGEPALVGVAIDIHRCIYQAGTAFTQQQFVTGGIQLITGETGGGPDDKVVHIVYRTIMNRALKSLPLHSRSAGNALIAEYLQHAGTELFGFLFALICLGID